MKKSDIYVGEGLLAQVQEPQPRELTVELLYKDMDPGLWWLLDILLEERTDLHDRIRKIKEELE